MKYLRPRLPEKEIELCLDLFDKQEAKKRILKYIEGVFDDAESQLKNCFIHDAVKEQDWEMFKVFAKLHPVEAYDSRPDDFCKFMRGEGYDLNNEQIKELVDSSR